MTRASLGEFIVWFGESDAPAPRGEVTSVQPSIRVAVAPADAGLAVAIDFRRSNRIRQRHALERASGGGEVAYFEGVFPVLRVGEEVEYSVSIRCGGERFLAESRVGDLVRFRCIGEAVDLSSGSDLPGASSVTGGAPASGHVQPSIGRASNRRSEPMAQGVAGKIPDSTASSTSSPATGPAPEPASGPRGPAEPFLRKEEVRREHSEAFDASVPASHALLKSRAPLAESDANAVGAENTLSPSRAVGLRSEARIRIENEGLVLTIEAPLSPAADRPFAVPLSLDPAGPDARIEASIKRNEGPVELLIVERTTGASGDFTLRVGACAPDDEVTIELTAFDAEHRVPAVGDEERALLRFHFPPKRPAVDMPVTEPIDALLPADDLPAADGLLRRLTDRGIETSADVVAAGDTLLTDVPAAEHDMARLLAAHATLSLTALDTDERSALIAAGFPTPVALAATPLPTLRQRLQGVMSAERVETLRSTASAQVAFARHTATGSAGVLDGEGGPAGRCGCGDCEAATSPLAYLVDLINYIGETVAIHPDVAGTADSELHLAGLVDLLRQPLSDLGASCSSVSDPVREVRLVIETLRRHLASTVPRDADVVCGAFPLPLEFIAAGDVDGDGRDELVVVFRNSNASWLQLPAGVLGGLWVMDFDPRTRRWSHLRPMDDRVGADVLLAPGLLPHAGFCADLDGDGRDEVILTVENGDGVRSLWMLAFDSDGGWDHLNPQTFADTGADLSFGTEGEVLGAFSADVDGDGEAELVVSIASITRPNAFWVFDLYQGVHGIFWRALSENEDSSLPAFECDPPRNGFAGYRPRLSFAADVDQDGRDEIVVYPDATGQLGAAAWVISYDPPAVAGPGNVGTWRHLRTNPLSSDLPAPWPWPARPAHAFAAETRGRNTTSLVLAMEDLRPAWATDPNRLYEQRYDSASPLSPWLPAVEIDASTGDQRITAAFGADVDGDLHDELIAVIDSRGRRGAWVMDRHDDGSWGHLSPISSDPLGADLQWTTNDYVFGGALAADVDRSTWGTQVSQELVFYGTQTNQIWVMTYDTASATWRHLSPALPADLESRYLLAAYRALLAGLGTSLEDLRAARGAELEERQALADRLGLPLQPDPARPETIVQLLIPPAELTEARLEALFGLADTSRDPLSSCQVGADPQGQIRRISLEGVTWSASPWISNVGPEGELLLSLTRINPTTVSLRLRRPDGTEVASGEGPLDGRARLANGLSGLKGFVDLAYTRDTTTIRVSALPRVTAWRMRYLRHAWDQQDWQPGRYAPGPMLDSQAFLPAIDPDIVGPDDFRVPLAATAEQPVGAFDLWLQRRAWVDARLGALETLQPDLDAMLATLRPAGGAAAVPSEDFPWAGAPATTAFEGLANAITRGSVVAANAARATVREALWLPVDAFLRLVSLSGHIRDSVVQVTPAEWAEVRSLLVQALKRRRHELWRSEEATADVTVGPDTFCAPLLASAEGEWPPPTPSERVWIDPEAVAMTDLPQSAAGALARGLWRTRRQELEVQASAIRAARNAGLEAMLVAAFGTPNAGTWRARVATLALELRSTDDTVATAARTTIGNEFALDVAAFVRLSALESKLSGGEAPSDTEWIDLEGALTTAHKRRVELPTWRAQEHALGAQLPYWRARRTALPRWRALEEDHAAFSEELRRRSRPPVVDPQRFAGNWLRSRAFQEPASDLYAGRRTWLLTRERDLRNARVSTASALAQFDSVLRRGFFDAGEQQRLIIDVGQRRAARGAVPLLFDIFGVTAAEIAALRVDLTSASAATAGRARRRVAEQLWMDPVAFDAMAMIVATPTPNVTAADWSRFDRILAEAELVGQLVAVTEQARATGVRARVVLGRLGLTAAAHGLLLRVRAVAVAGEPILDDEWDDVVAIALRALKQRQFGRWLLEELGAVPERRVRLGPDAFVMAEYDPNAHEGQPRAWLTTPDETRWWRDTLEARINVAREVATGVHDTTMRAEELTLPILRDAILEAISPPDRDAARWASDSFLIDAQAGACAMTTRAAHAIDALLALLWSLRTGQLRDSYPQLALVGPSFDADWQWIGSYATWRSAVLVRLYPQNLLRPNLRRHQTPMFAEILRELRGGGQLSLRSARRLARRYADYFQDVCNLDLTNLACSRVTGWTPDPGEDARAGTFDFLIAQSEVSGSLYWSTLELGQTAAQAGYAHSYWRSLDRPADAVVSIIGATTYRPVPAIAASGSGQGWVYVFLLTRDVQRMGIAFTRYNLATRQWEAAQDLESPTDAVFTAWIGSGPSSQPPTLLFESTRVDATGGRRRILSRATMDGKGIAWGANGIEELEQGPWTRRDGQLTQAPRQLLALDADGNGIHELAAVPTASGRIEFFSASATGALSRTGQTSRAIEEGALVCVGDFDADQQHEIAWNLPPTQSDVRRSTAVLIEKRGPAGWAAHFPDLGRTDGASAGATATQTGVTQTLLSAHLVGPRRDQLLLGLPASFEMVSGSGGSTIYTGTYGAFFTIGLTSTGYHPNAPWIYVSSPDLRTPFDRLAGVAFTCSPAEVAGPALHVVAADFDGDGRDELVQFLASRDGPAGMDMSVGNDFWALDYRRTGTLRELGPVVNPRLNTVGDLSTGSRPVAAAIAADIDGDGCAELIAVPYLAAGRDGSPAVTGSRVWVAKFRPGGGLDPAEGGSWVMLPEIDLSRESASVAHVVAADIDGDGADELFLFGTGRTWVRKYDKSRGAWVALPDPLEAGYTVAVAAAGRFLPGVAREQVVVSFGTTTPEQQQISGPYNQRGYGDFSVGSRYRAAAAGAQVTLLALTVVPDTTAQPQCSHTGITPAYRGSTQDWLLDDRANIEVRRQRTRQAFEDNDGSPASVMTYLWEAFYALPVAVALALQRSGNHTHALDWFRLTYDYTRPLDERKTFYGLIVDEQPTAGPEFGASLLEWLRDPLDVTNLAATRANTFTRGIIQLIISCLLDAGDAEFTVDTSESIERARLLYGSALTLLELDILNERYDGCADVIGRVTARFNDPTVRRIMGEIGGELSEALGESALTAALEVVARELTNGNGDGPDRAREYARRRLAEAPPPATLEESVASAARGPLDSQLPRLAFRDTATMRVAELTGAWAWSWGASSGPDMWFCVGPNPVLKALRLHAELGLYKIRTCRSIDGLRRTLDYYSAATDQESGLPMIGATGQLVLAGARTAPPTPYRYSALVERARDLTRTTQQMEAFLLAALERRDQEAYTLLQARQTGRIARETVRLSELEVRTAEDRILLGELQQERALVEQELYTQLLAAGDSELERDALELLEQSVAAGNIAVGFGIGATVGYAAAAAAYVSAAYAGVSASLVAQALSATAQTASSAGQVASTTASIRATQSQLAYMRAGLERTRQNWQARQRLAAEDVRIGLQQTRIETDGLRVAEQQRTISQLSANNAEQLVDYLMTKFTSVELYEWMSEHLERAYATVLQHACATARMAANQLAFERQSDAPTIAADYWSTPAEDGALDPSTSNGPDRRGLTGAERLLADLVSLDQFAFETNVRKLQLTKTFSLAMLAPLELERLRSTGVMAFATPAELFDQDFPGHYLRLIKRVSVSLIALVPPTEGMHATLASSGISRVVVGPDLFQTIAVRRNAQTVPLSAPVGATGQFTFETESALTNPFEFEGVDRTWEFQLPKAAQPLRLPHDRRCPRDNRLHGGRQLRLSRTGRPPAGSPLPGRARVQPAHGLPRRLVGVAQPGPVHHPVYCGVRRLRG